MFFLSLFCRRLCSAAACCCLMCVCVRILLFSVCVCCLLCVFYWPIGHEGWKAITFSSAHTLEHWEGSDWWESERASVNWRERKRKKRSQIPPTSISRSLVCSSLVYWFSLTSAHSLDDEFSCRWFWAPFACYLSDSFADSADASLVPLMLLLLLVLLKLDAVSLLLARW